MLEVKKKRHSAKSHASAFSQTSNVRENIKRNFIETNIKPPYWPTNMAAEHNVNISILLGCIGDYLSPLNKQTNAYIKAHKYFPKNSDFSNA